MMFNGNVRSRCKNRAVGERVAELGLLDLPALDDARLGQSGFPTKLSYPERDLFSHTIRDAKPHIDCGLGCQIKEQMRQNTAGGLPETNKPACLKTLQATHGSNGVKCCVIHPLKGSGFRLVKVCRRITKTLTARPKETTIQARQHNSEQGLLSPHRV
jgi:hypothetical protein